MKFSFYLEMGDTDNMKKCSECEFAHWSDFFKAYTCKHEKGLGIIFKGKTRPHKCPLGNSTYLWHGNRDSGIMDQRNFIPRGYHN